MEENKRVYQVIIAILAVVAVALAAGNVYFLTRPDEPPDYQVVIGVPKGGNAVDFTQSEILNHDETQTVIFGLIDAERMEESLMPTSDPDAVMYISVPEDGIIYYQTSIWLKEDGVWMRTGDHLFQYLPNGYGGEKMAQIVQKQLDLGAKSIVE
ncbi:hypothetical protein [Pseudoflavonifractor sp. An85]|uniref:hypothetical protein n=1 Tax=Pseudoflavonifractor sp. An85 TaxID=1965661 RepID=UPI000B37873B|nr:hypothetical protein [Pseudoflavonifractor sp. An85]OUN24402.1 hypothetical protein B5G37_07260 [Pseudoflavonifractor sp. An85]